MAEIAQSRGAVVECHPSMWDRSQPPEMTAIDVLGLEDDQFVIEVRGTAPAAIEGEMKWLVRLMLPMRQMMLISPTE